MNTERRKKLLWRWTVIVAVICIVSVFLNRLPWQAIFIGSAGTLIIVWYVTGSWSRKKLYNKIIFWTLIIAVGLYHLPVLTIQTAGIVGLLYVVRYLLRLLKLAWEGIRWIHEYVRKFLTAT